MDCYKRLLMTIAIAIGFVNGFAQETQIQEEKVVSHNMVDAIRESPFSLTLELANRYIWRGLEYGDAPVAFPMISYTTGGFCAWGMGAYAINGSHQEVDLGITYTYNMLTAGLSDYYYPSAVGSEDNYFEVKSHETGHWGELYATVAPEKVPVWLTLSCYVYGADKKPNGKQAYSSYAEVGYKYNFKDDNSISLTLGASLNKGFYTDYDGGFNVVNAALTYSTAFNFGKFKLPVSGSYVLNPYKEKSYFKFSMYFGL